MAFPEPPWTQAPSEVIAWGSSIRGRMTSTASSHPPTRVKGYEARVPAAEEARIRRRMSSLGLGSSNPVQAPHLVPRLAHRARAEVFVGRVGGTRIEIRLRKRNRLEVRVTFIPQTAFRKAWRIVSRLGLHPAEGTWR